MGDQSRTGVIRHFLELAISRRLDDGDGDGGGGGGRRSTIWHQQGAMSLLLLVTRWPAAGRERPGSVKSDEAGSPLGVGLFEKSLGNSASRLAGSRSRHRNTISCFFSLSFPLWQASLGFDFTRHSLAAAVFLFYFLNALFCRGVTDGANILSGLLNWHAEQLFRRGVRVLYRAFPLVATG